MAKDFILNRKEPQKLAINFLLVLIANVLHRPIDLTLLSEKTHTSIDVINQNLAVLARKGFITYIDGNEVTVSRKQRIELIIFTLKQGCDIERVCMALGWREFEDIVVLILEQNGFQTMKHFRFKSGVKRYEIDILAYKDSLILSIDCKRWTRSWQMAATIKVINAQVERTRALIQSFLSLKNFFEVTNLINISFIPLIVTLSETPYKIYEKVPAVPIFHFQNFLDEMNTHIARLMILKVT